MIHHYVEHGKSDHYAVGVNAGRSAILLQVDAVGDQARIVLSLAESRHLITLLQNAITEMETGVKP